MKKETASTYLAYLLRLWRDNETVPWRASVEDARTGERRGFANLKTLLAFLEKQTGVILTNGENHSDALGKKAESSN
ncbi:MAG TPA: hypothetical protein ENK24_02755 [Anaerolineae bacterium]|nr:hypothetical protein [Anaerolineae bacterium]